MSGERVFENEADAWFWFQLACGDRLWRREDWHGVAYARQMQRQTWVAPPDYGPPWPPAPAYLGYRDEPLWVSTCYGHAPLAL